VEFDSPNSWYKSLIFKRSYSKEQKEAFQRTKGKPSKGLARALGDEAYVIASVWYAYALEGESVDLPSIPSSRDSFAPVPAKQGIEPAMVGCKRKSTGQSHSGLRGFFPV